MPPRNYSARDRSDPRERPASFLHARATVCAAQTSTHVEVACRIPHRGYSPRSSPYGSAFHEITTRNFYDRDLILFYRLARKRATPRALLDEFIIVYFCEASRRGPPDRRWGATICLLFNASHERAFTRLQWDSFSTRCWHARMITVLSQSRDYDTGRRFSTPGPRKILQRRRGKASRFIESRTRADGDFQQVKLFDYVKPLPSLESARARHVGARRRAGRANTIDFTRSYLPRSLSPAIRTPSTIELLDASFFPPG